MFGRSLTMVTNAPMLCQLEVNSNTFQKVKMQFRWASAKFAEAANRITNIRTTSNIGVHQFT